MFRILPAWGCSDKMAVSLTVPGSAGWVVPPVQAVRAVSGFNPVPESAPFSHFSAMPSRPRGRAPPGCGVGRPPVAGVVGQRHGAALSALML